MSKPGAKRVEPVSLRCELTPLGVSLLSGGITSTRDTRSLKQAMCRLARESYWPPAALAALLAASGGADGKRHKNQAP